MKKTSNFILVDIDKWLVSWSSWTAEEVTHKMWMLTLDVKLFRLVFNTLSLVGELELPGPGCLPCVCAEAV